MALWEVVKYKEVGNVLRFYPRNRDSNTVNRDIDRILMGIYIYIHIYIELYRGFLEPYFFVIWLIYLDKHPIRGDRILYSGTI
jgi:hypothetical protein